MPRARPNEIEIEIDATGQVVAFGPYVVHGVLGRGGMGIVYEVLDRSSGDVRALKSVERRFLDPELQVEQRFRHEIAILSRLDHPGIIQTYTSGFARHPMGYDLAYYVMEKLVGETLAARLAARAVLELPEALSVGKALARALDYLARSGVLHRDIKPGNVFLTRDGRVVLLDFGLARSEEFTKLTAAGQLVGTFTYMAPERLLGEPGDMASDVYALGVLLFQALSGRSPYGTGSPVDLVSSMEAGIDWPAPIIALGRDLRLLLESALAVDPAIRPSPAELADRLEALERPARVGPRASTLLIEDSGPAATVPLVESYAAPPSLLPLGSPPEPAVRAVVLPTVETPAAQHAPGRAITLLLAGTATCLAFAAGLLLGASRAEVRIPAAHRRLGDLHRARGDPAAAIIEYQLYLRLAPEAEDAARIRTAVEALRGPEAP